MSARRELTTIGTLWLTGQGGAPTTALLLGYGTSASPASTGKADAIFATLWMKNTAATGTARGMRLNLALTGGAGGESLRARTVVSAAAPVDTCNGAHINLEFGASAGNITGLATGVRANILIPARTITGTIAPVMSEFYANATTSNVSNGALLYCNIGGDATGAALLEDSVCFLNLAVTGGTINTGNILHTNTNTATHGLRCKILGAEYDILLKAI